jgi:MFS transporter, MHS family, shikimate and dehydroshikimate transport protein
MMPEGDFKSWGWRIPFLLSILLLGVGWFVPARVPETPIFEELKRRGAISRNPFIEVIFKNPRSFLVAVGLKISEVSWFYILTVFIVVFATSRLNLPRVLLLNAIFIAAQFRYSTGCRIISGGASSIFSGRFSRPASPFRCFGS